MSGRLTCVLDNTGQQSRRENGRLISYRANVLGVCSVLLYFSPTLSALCFAARLENEQKEKLNYDRARLNIRLVPSASSLDDQESDSGVSLRVYVSESAGGGRATVTDTGGEGVPTAGCGRVLSAHKRSYNSIRERGNHRLEADHSARQVCSHAAGNVE
ncbi:hypothetical protein J6590_080963 [Homalodisca vitripennis]|nr:hypothetical protein J6590_080963 [Homalodisca vitripennis]